MNAQTEPQEIFLICAAYAVAWVDWLIREEGPRLLSNIVQESASVHVQPYIDEIIQDAEGSTS